jgi:hypothetical protein
VVEREPFPRVVEAADRVVEREGDDDDDREQDVRERRDREHGEQVASHEGQRAREAARADRGRDRDARHTDTRSVPRARA